MQRSAFYWQVIVWGQVRLISRMSADFALVDWGIKQPRLTFCHLGASCGAL
jgi:hypothetical protein